MYDEFTANNQILVGTGAGTGVPLDVAAQSLLGRFGGDLDDLAFAASRWCGRLAAGNLKACTNAELMTEIGAANIGLTNVTHVRKTAAYTCVATDFIIACATSGAAFTLKMEAAPADGRRIMVIDAGGTFNTNNLTLDGNGKNINGAATKVTGARWAVITLYYDSTAGQWTAGTTTAL